MEVDLYLLSEAKLGQEIWACHRLVGPEGQAHSLTEVPPQPAATALAQQAPLDLEEHVREQASLQGTREPDGARTKKTSGQRMPQQSGLESQVVRWRWVLSLPVYLVQ